MSLTVIMITRSRKFCKVKNELTVFAEQVKNKMSTQMIW